MRMMDAGEEWIGPGRAFALALTLLDDTLRSRVLDAYLLARIVQAVECAVPAPRLARRSHLLSLAAVVRSGSEHDARAFARDAQRGCENPHCASLIGHLPTLLSSSKDWPAETGERVREIVAEMAARNAAFSMRARLDGSIPLQSLEELIAYCDANAGMLARSITELLLAYETPTIPFAARLRQLAPEYGQGAQLVEMLARPEGLPRVPGYVSGDIDLHESTLASEVRLRRAESYVQTLRAASARRAIVAFATVPVVWARTELNSLLVTSGLMPAGVRLDGTGGTMRRGAAAPS